MPKTGRHTKKSPLTVRSHRFKFTSPLETNFHYAKRDKNGMFFPVALKGLHRFRMELPEKRFGRNWGEPPELGGLIWDRVTSRRQSLGQFFWGGL